MSVLLLTICSFTLLLLFTTGSSQEHWDRCKLKSGFGLCAQSHTSQQIQLAAHAGYVHSVVLQGSLYSASEQLYLRKREWRETFDIFEQSVQLNLSVKLKST